jgi:hypothetical protein
VATLIGSCAWAWATFDFWETVPLIPCVALAGILGALAVYTWRGQVANALATGIVMAALTWVGTFFMTLRWTR